ncbi:MAG: cysteine desulfurase [Flavobacteriaceae bacterium]|nr:cysteine desulfurase [Flavobacteriaceae bacterium]
MFDVKKIREDFPILNEKVNGKALVYFDNGATNQKPNQVVNSIVDYYKTTNSNIHRGVHSLSQKATEAFENARIKIQNHFNIGSSKEVILTKGTTESINLVASCFTSIVSKGDEILVSALEHHSNIVPWQLLCERTGAELKVIPMNQNGELEVDKLDILINENTKLVAVNHISNALGIINPIELIIEKAHKVGAAVLIDGAQSSPHLKIDIQKLDCDFYTVSAHKMCGPTGVGVLFGKQDWLNKMVPYHGGGEMIKEVSFEKTTYADLPHKFEAGTPNIAGVIAFGEAIDYLNNIGLENIEKYENSLLVYAQKQLLDIEDVKIYGESDKKAAVISFNIEGVHPYDIGHILDQQGVAVRTGHHCTQPIMSYFDIPGTVRASFSFYNTIEEIDVFVSALKKAIRMLK